MNESGTHRLFVAFAVPEVVRAELARAQQELRELLPPHSAAWTKPDHLHLTLRFLGNVDGQRGGELLGRLRAAVAGFGGMNLICERLGCFPDLRFPRVVWAGVRDADEKLAALAQRVNGAVAPFAEKSAETVFTGHITLARLNKIRPSDAERLEKFVGAAVDRRFGAWRANELELIRSELSAGGSRYTTLAKCPLNRDAAGA
jgi:RNA 2',3'-cyclic 3'-phosphodiesterase